MAAVNVVKRRGGAEEFDERKVYASVYNTCLQETERGKQDCEEVAAAVTDYVAEQVAEREEVLSVEIRMWARNRLKEIDERLAQAYYTHQ